MLYFLKTWSCHRLLFLLLLEWKDKSDQKSNILYFSLSMSNFLNTVNNIHLFGCYVKTLNTQTWNNGKHIFLLLKHYQLAEFFLLFLCLAHTLNMFYALHFNEIWIHQILISNFPAYQRWNACDILVLWIKWKEETFSWQCWRKDNCLNG